MFVSRTAIEVLKTHDKLIATKLSLFFKHSVYFSKDVTLSCSQYWSFTSDHRVKSPSVVSVDVQSFKEVVSSFTATKRQQLRESTHSEPKSVISFSKTSSFVMTTDPCCVLYALTSFPLIYLMLNKLFSPLNHCCVCLFTLINTRPVLRRTRSLKSSLPQRVGSFVCK